MLLDDRTKVTRTVLAFLAGCAVVGFIMGLKGALPAGADPETGTPLATTPSGVIVEATTEPQDSLLTNEEEKTDEEEKAEAEKADEDARPAPAAEAPKSEPVAPAAPKEEAPPADPVGDLLTPPAPTPPPDIY